MNSTFRLFISSICATVIQQDKKTVPSVAVRLSACFDSISVLGGLVETAYRGGSYDALMGAANIKMDVED